MTLVLLALLSASPVRVIRIETFVDQAPIARITTANGEKVCPAGPHARIYLRALEACRPGDARISAVEVQSSDVKVFAKAAKKDLGQIVCAVRPPVVALRNEAEACVLGLR